ncbi:hypothetical protein [Thermus islandicus]|uniref:hypothetical protein n=1 Tax=Thermus islandicus TaxID=540988 RepID=UPI0003B650C0|nr:hypothetical protein [Thermus islandicus]
MPPGPGGGGLWAGGPPRLEAIPRALFPSETFRVLKEKDLKRNGEYCTRREEASPRGVGLFKGHPA